MRLVRRERSGARALFLGKQCTVSARHVNVSSFTDKGTNLSNAGFHVFTIVHTTVGCVLSCSQNAKPLQQSLILLMAELEYSFLTA